MKKKSKIRAIYASLLSGIFLFSAVANAQSVTLTVTPPLFQLTMGRGEFWASAIRIVNANDTDLTVYGTVADLEAEGEEGHSRFHQPPADGSSLGSWIKLNDSSVTIPRGGTGEIGFTIRVPDDASPGGHYASVLVGTRPPAVVGSPDGKPGSEGAMLAVSSYISSLFFVRITGEVQEKGDIREFVADKEWYDRPHAQFALRFENTGNVHLRPQGDILIKDMWGEERGKIPLNQKTDFGNVLPGTVRKFSLDWDGEESIFRTGRYTALVTLAYGTNPKQYTTRSLVFWYVPVKELLASAGALLLAFLLLWYIIRTYVRRTLKREMSVRSGEMRSSHSPQPHREEKGEGRVVDLRK